MALQELFGEEGGELDPSNPLTTYGEPHLSEMTIILTMWHEE
jgi:hypothetical protein